MITDALIERIIGQQNPTCVGLDTSFEYLPEEMRAGAKDFSAAAERIFEFNKKLIDSLYDVVPSVKVQIAYYEMYGVPGLRAFEETLRYAAEKGLIVIADAKRNDIGSTAACYSAAFLGETAVEGNGFRAFPADYLTVNAYLGTDGVQPFVKDCAEEGQGDFRAGQDLQPLGAGNCRTSSLRTERPYTNTWVPSWKNGGRARKGNTAIRRSAPSWARRIPRRRRGFGSCCRTPSFSSPATARRAETRRC